MSYNTLKYWASAVSDNRKTLKIFVNSEIFANSDVYSTRRVIHGEEMAE